MNEWVHYALTFGAIGSAMIGGLLFAFSAFIMKALGQIPTPEGMRAMQSINRVILNPLFFSAFFGTAILAIAAIALHLANGHNLSHWTWLAGASYLIGPIFITIVGNVPLNNRLAEADPSSETGRELWSYYLHQWTRLNHIRTVISLFAAFCFIQAIINL